MNIFPQPKIAAAAYVWDKKWMMIRFCFFSLTCTYMVKYCAVTIGHWYLTNITITPQEPSLFFTLISHFPTDLEAPNALAPIILKCLWLSFKQTSLADFTGPARSDCAVPKFRTLLNKCYFKIIIADWLINELHLGWVQVYYCK